MINSEEFGYGSFCSMNRGPQYRPPNTIIFITGAPKQVPLIFEPPLIVHAAGYPVFFCRSSDAQRLGVSCSMRLATEVPKASQAFDCRAAFTGSGLWLGSFKVLRSTLATLKAMGCE